VLSQDTIRVLLGQDAEKIAEVVGQPGLSEELRMNLALAFEYLGLP